MKVRGNCYVTSEAVFHLLGGRKAGWKAMCMQHEGDTHWFIKHETGMIIDLTVSQFKTKPDHSKARGTAFMTQAPSKRAKAMMRQLVWQ